MGHAHRGEKKSKRFFNLALDTHRELPIVVYMQTTKSQSAGARTQTKFQVGEQVGVLAKDRFDFNHLGEILKVLGEGYYQVWVETDLPRGQTQTMHERNLEKL
jgi:uncharacterized protein YjlB